MKNKPLLFAGLASLLGISAISLVSANNVSAASVDAANTSTATMQTQSATREGGKMGRRMFKGEGKGMGGHGAGFMREGEKGMMFGGNEAMKTAITNNDYTAFVSAWNADTNKPSDATVPTQEQFTRMVTMEQKRTAEETAIANNDYNAYVKAVTPTQEQFAERVNMYKARQTMDAAIANNDYTAFQEAVKNTPIGDKEITQEEFTKMVTRKTEMAQKTAQNQ